jgi:hypothetical protein
MAESESRESQMYARVMGVLMVLLLFYGLLTIIGVIR